MELAGITGAAEQWKTAVDVAVLAENLGYDSIWVYDHFHNVPKPAQEPWIARENYFYRRRDLWWAP